MNPLPLPPPPPYTPPSLKQTKPSPLYHFTSSKQSNNHQSFIQEPLHCRNNLRTARKQQILPQPRKTNSITWCGAILCLVFILLIIIFGIATIILFVNVKPKYPVFDTPAASLSVIYFNSPTYLNGDLVFLANFSNPNRKLDVRYENLYFELYFSEFLIATQVVQPFSEVPGEARWISVHLLSSLVYLDPHLALELQKQAQRNRIRYNIRGTFKVRVKLGIFHYSYWLHGKCELEMASPPNGGMISHTCKTKR